VSTTASQPLNPGADPDHDDDSYLLLYMADAASDRALAEAAFEVFVSRHWDLLIGFCRQQRFETFGNSAEDFVNATFLKAFEHAASFKPPHNADEQAIRRKVQNWLFTILKRLFFDTRRKLWREIDARKSEYGDEKIAPFQQSENYVDCEAIPQESERQAVSARRRNLLEQFMQGLSDRDRAIFLQTQDYIDPHTGNTSIPPEELAALAAQFGIPPEHIRIYRKRLIDRLRQFIEAAEASSP
jgi:RNA polymerase sigma factor (sigma-70 family)